ncbi:hypothetical protein I2486_10460 [Cellulophaga sp. E16_2]|uniref:hypothetical protein n=1 Tax=Cellulophaga sp. E16_2 TaxID=2789297 RepID=UPI001A91B2FC|nr:hypothetical protein [Cellulophaga sp. E16_2]MBO0591828.1 hypothetical protein [Cellulophaga sp. E16_2]
MLCLKFFALKILLFSAILITKAQETEVQIIPEKLSDNLFMLTGQGGNISIFSREDHIFMIDNPFKPLSKPLKETFAILALIQFQSYTTHLCTETTQGEMQISIQKKLL